MSFPHFFHRFVRDENEDLSSWEKRLARKYYDKLFKEYCLADMSRYKEGQVRVTSPRTELRFLHIIRSPALPTCTQHTATHPGFRLVCDGVLNKKYLLVKDNLLVALKN